jgi:uncharacterized protein (TIGR03790 family)
MLRNRPSSPWVSPVLGLAVLLVLGACGGSSSSSGSSPNPPSSPIFLDPKAGLQPEDLAVIVNENDPQSVQVGAYYQTARHIPAANMIYIHMTAGVPTITSAEFNAIKAQVDAATPANVQAYALTWAAPYQVQCMSITTAFALGFSTTYCMTGSGCNTTAPSQYYNSTSTRPYDDFHMRPAMSLAGTSFANVKALIDRGVNADGKAPTGTAYLVTSKDSARSVRGYDFSYLASFWKSSSGLTAKYLDQSITGPGYITGATDVMAYLASLASVPNIATNTYLPGAIADHLTSYGGMLTNSGQMSALRWLEAGATGSYGTVSEPCNFTEKFPQASVLIPHYFGGESLIEAYWKSVAWPGQGIFVGEPLANPYRDSMTMVGDEMEITVRWLTAGKTFQVESANAPSGPFTLVMGNISPDPTGVTHIAVPHAAAGYYRLVQSP